MNIIRHRLRGHCRNRNYPFAAGRLHSYLPDDRPKKKKKNETFVPTGGGDDNEK